MSSQCSAGEGEGGWAVPSIQMLSSLSLDPGLRTEDWGLGGNTNFDLEIYCIDTSSPRLAWQSNIIMPVWQCDTWLTPGCCTDWECHWPHIHMHNSAERLAWLCPVQQSSLVNNIWSSKHQQFIPLFSPRPPPRPLLPAADYEIK